MTTTIKTPRETLAEVIRKTKTGALNTVEGCSALADAIISGLERRDLLIAEAADVMDPPDEHMRLLKRMRTRIMRDVDDDETSSRDLAALTNRMQTLSKEIFSLEERQRAENKSSGGKRNGSTSRATGPVAAGQVDI